MLQRFLQPHLCAERCGGLPGSCLEFAAWPRQSASKSFAAASSACDPIGHGCSCDDDRFRIVYIALYLSAIHDALKRGIDVRGYLYWSLMDNYEWNSFVPRFGIVDVDYKTFMRTPKPSAYFFKEIIEKNGFSQEILRKYLKEMPSLV